MLGTQLEGRVDIRGLLGCKPLVGALRGSATQDLVKNLFQTASGSARNHGDSYGAFLLHLRLLFKIKCRFVSSPLPVALTILTTHADFILDS